MGGCVAVVAAALVVVACYQSLTDLHSVDMTDSIKTYLKSGVGKSLGMSVSDVQDILRVTLMVAAAAAAVSVVLGIHVLKRDKGARIGLTIAGAVLLCTAPMAGGMLAVLVGVAAALTWTAPARDWFAGRPPREPARVAALGDRRPPAPPTAQQPPIPPIAPPPASPLAPPVVPPAAPPAGELPPPTYGFGAPAPSLENYPPPAYVAPPRSQYDQPAPPVGKRPVNILVAATLTWVFSGLTLVVAVILMGVLALDKQALLDAAAKNAAIKDADLTQNMIVAALWVVCVILAGLAVAAAVFALYAWRRHNWARIALTVTSAVGLLLCIGSLPFSLVHIFAMIGTIAMLYAGPSNDWFRGGQLPPRPGGQPPVW
jgi:hypothetical protein